MVTHAAIKTLIESPVEKRVAVLKHDFGYFFAYYFPHYIKYQFAPFHYDMFQDVHDLLDGRITELAWFAFRESAKSSIAMALICYLICFDSDEYVNVYSYDSVNAKRLLFDVVLELQMNARILNDFGHIYNTKRTADEATQKSIRDFVTNPIYDDNGNRIREGIRVEAHSTGSPIRGRRHGSSRPGLLILDDFENEKTIRSEPDTENIAKHIQSFKGGLDTKRGRVMYLGNYISEFANVQSIIERSKVDTNLRVRIIPIADDTGPTWPEKYVMTDI